MEFEISKNEILFFHESKLIIKSTSDLGLENSTPNFIQNEQIRLKIEVNKEDRLKINNNSELIQSTWILKKKIETEFSLMEVTFLVKKNAGKPLKIKDPNLSFLIPKESECFWVPHLKVNPDDVIGEHIFRNPCVLFENNSYSFGILPDFMFNNAPSPLRQYLHLEHKKMGSLLTLGFCSQKSYGHVFFKRTGRSAVLNNKKKNQSIIKLKFYIILVNGDRNKLLAQISKFTLFRYSRNFLKNLYTAWPKGYDDYNIIDSKFKIHPLIQPISNYIEYSMDRYFSNFHGWISFQLNQTKCGGMFMRSFTGSGRGKYFSITPNKLKKLANDQWNLSYKMLHKWYQSKIKYWVIRFILRFFGPKFPKYIWNTAWFMQIRTAYGLYYWGKQLNRLDYVQKAISMKNLLINTPNHGYFPSICLPQDSGEVLWLNSSKAFEFSDSYHTADMALALYWLLKFENDLENVISDSTMKRCQESAMFLMKCQLDNGAIPSYVNEDGISSDKALENSAESGAIGMFLLELYQHNPKKEYLETSKRIAEFLQKNVIPTNRWVDFELKYSCPMFDHVYPNYEYHPKLGPQSNLCISWAIEMYRLLYITTSEKKYLNIGVGLLDYLSLFQQMWSPPFLDAHLFGGFGVMNIDGEWSDIRQACFSRLYLEYFKLTNRVDLLLRGIAALRASFPLILNPKNRSIAPGNFRLVGKKDYGVAYENYGHQGWNEGTIGLTTVDWGIGTAFFAAAYAKLHFEKIFKEIINKIN
ncbi:MAG: hypothetical protein ACTSWX_07845 [Promethearchaeota archaeon]